MRLFACFCALRVLLGALGTLLGALGALLGRSWGTLERSWGALGALLGALGSAWTILVRPRLDFGPSRGRFRALGGSILRSVRVDLGDVERRRFSHEFLSVFA